MKDFTMTSKLKSIALSISAVLLWLLVWEIGARLIDARMLFPTISDVVLSLARDAITTDFWLTILFSVFRILLGFIIGTVFGIFFALASMNRYIHTLIKPLITVARCTPVASFIMLVWLLISDALEPLIPSVIALLMVFPVVWQSAYNAVSAPPKELDEVARIYGFGRKKRLIYLTVPAMLKSTLPSIITASGLAWKSGVAAEVITYTKNSIGRSISEAKNSIDGASMIAWTLVVILLGLALEAIIKYLSGKADSVWEY